MGLTIFARGSAYLGCISALAFGRVLAPRPPPTPRCLLARRMTQEQANGRASEAGGVAQRIDEIALVGEVELARPIHLHREGGRRDRDLLHAVNAQRRAVRGDRSALDGLTNDRDQLARLQSLARLGRHSIDGVEEITKAPALERRDEADRRIVEE